MIERLVRTLQVLAAPSDVQLTLSPRFDMQAEELAGDFDDARRLLYDCPQVEVGAHQRDCLDRVHAVLDERSGVAGFWTEAAIRTSPEWEELRGLARSALASFGLPIARRPLSRALAR